MTAKNVYYCHLILLFETQRIRYNYNYNYMYICSKMLDKVRVEVNCLHRPGTQKPFQFVLEPNVWWEVVLNISLQVIWGNFRPTQYHYQKLYVISQEFCFSHF